MHRSKIVVLLMVTVAFCAFGYGQNGGIRFALTDLQSSLPSSATSSSAIGINEGGAVVGAYVDSSGNSYCFTWSIILLRGHGLRQVKTFISTVWPYSCIPVGINKNGNVAGNIEDLQPFGSGPAFAFLYTNAFTNFPSGSYAFGINDYNQVIGAMGWIYYATLWTSNGQAVVLDPNPLTEAVATTPNGTEVVAFLNSAPPVASIWPALSPVNYGHCQALSSQFAFNVNGHLVGSLWCNGNAYGPDQWATLWTNPSQPPQIIGATGSTTALGISSDDWVVGQDTGSGVGLIRDPNCLAMVDVNSLLDSTGAGWKVIAAWGINTAHKIVGQATNSAGQTHAVLLTPDNNLNVCIPD